MNALFTPFSIRDVTFKNRIAVSPMQQYSATDGIPGHWHLVHLGSRAVGGAGLIITECTAVSPEGMCTPYDVGIWSKQQIEGWKSIVDFVHLQDAKIAIQLWHAGGKASSKHPNEGMKPLSVEEGGWMPLSSSSTPIGSHHPKAMSVEEIQQVKIDFASAAKNAVEAGFDAIELHAAHGYLLHQFYSALVNRRTDTYGGSFESRIRLLLEVIQEVRKVIPVGMPLLVRLSAVDYSERPEAWTLDDSLKLSLLLKEHGVDLITASGGGFVHVNKDIVKPNYQLPFATKIKQEVDIPVGAVGMIVDAHQANTIIERKEADLVVMAREHLRDPYFSINAALTLGDTPDVPWQYKRAYSSIKL